MRRVQRLLEHAAPGSGVKTHDVINQTPFFEGYNAYLGCRRMQECVAAFAHPQAPDHTQRLVAWGKVCGAAESLEDARLCNEHPPTFAPFDRQGRRVDSVAFHPSYHTMLRIASEHGVPTLGWTASHSQLPRSAMAGLQYQLECGTGCPLTMRYAAVPVLQRHNKGGAFDQWIAKLSAPAYDQRDVHISEKAAVMCGMSMTEKQGGSDVRSNTTTAARSVTEGEYLITGHKWFTSAPMCDAFLTLAKTDAGVSCFLVPRWTAPGERNAGLRFQRLKPKVGDRSNASSEVEYHGAVGYLVGAEGAGVRTIIDMVHHTRLDCLNGSAALQHIAVSHACHHAAHRTAFGSLLREKPLMRSVLCDLALEAEASVALGLRIAAAFDRSEEEAFRRVAVAIAKYHVCKRTPAVVYEALEVLGGNGFVEESPMSRFYRQAPLNAVWEGSGNVIVLDVFRALAKEKDALPAIMAEIQGTGDERLTKSLGRCVAFLQAAMASGDVEASGRRVVEHLAVLLQATALQKCGPKAISEAFIASRLAAVDVAGMPMRSAHFGAIPGEAVLVDLIDRHLPVAA